MHYDFKTGFIVITWADKLLAFAMEYFWFMLLAAVLVSALAILKKPVCKDEARETDT